MPKDAEIEERPQVGSLMLTRERRCYPVACSSAFCGAVSTSEQCQACHYRAQLERWNRWVKDTEAAPVSPGSLIYEAQIGERSYRRVA